MLEELEQTKIMSGITVTAGSTGVAWLAEAQTFLSMGASFVAIVVGIFTIRSLLKKGRIQSLEKQYFERQLNTLDARKLAEQEIMKKLDEQENKK
jgi:TctA family transporter